MAKSLVRVVAQRYCMPQTLIIPESLFWNPYGKRVSESGILEKHINPCCHKMYKLYLYVCIFPFILLRNLTKKKNNPY